MSDIDTIDTETDLDLLASYTGQKSEDAFAEVVRRHLNLVFSAALRQVRSTTLAEEVAQSTFMCLARDAHRLAPGTVLSAWLYQVAHRTAANVVRREARRQLREQIATELNAMNATDADWIQVAPLLDEAMQALDDTDRSAVLLRFFENKSLRDVGQAVGVSENAAQKRLIRAIEQLRDYFARHGVRVASSALVVVISANAVQGAPSGLAAAVVAAAIPLGGTALITTTSALKVFNLKVTGALLVTFLAGAIAYYLWSGTRTTTPIDQRVAIEALTENERYYQEMIAAYPIASEMAEGDPTRALWEDRKATLLQAGYIETRSIRFRRPFSPRGAADRFFIRFHGRFRGVEVALTRMSRETPPIARVTARRADFGSGSPIEQFIREYDPEKP